MTKGLKKNNFSEEHLGKVSRKSGFTEDDPKANFIDYADYQKEAPTFLSLYLLKLQSVTKIVRLAVPASLLNVGCKFACSFLATNAWHNFSRL